jgi:hypothetical protein
MADDRRGESPAERADRNFDDLLQELRVAQTGVQFLFAFLLTAPLQAGYGRLDRYERTVLIIDVVVLAIAAVCLVCAWSVPGLCLIAPVAWHRALFRQHFKDEVMDAANRLAQAGLAFLAVGMVLSITLAIDLVTPRWLALTLGAGIALLALLAVSLWLVLPIRNRRALRD